MFTTEHFLQTGQTKDVLPKLKSKPVKNAFVDEDEDSDDF